jgi:hypothetical protein
VAPKVLIVDLSRLQSRGQRLFKIIDKVELAAGFLTWGGAKKFQANII